MKMNCKQGDLAVYVGRPVYAIDDASGDRVCVVRAGMIFRCVEPTVLLCEPAWKIDPVHVNIVFPSGSTFEADIDACTDDDLRPLRESDGEGEMQRIAGLPSDMTQAA